METEATSTSLRYAWYVVFILILAYITSFLDRQILSLLVDPIRQDLGITDFQIGTTVNVGIIRGGERPNVVAEHAECEFDMRVLTHDEAERAQRLFREIAAMQFVPDTTTEFSGQMLFPPLQRHPRNEMLFSWVQEAGHKLDLNLKDVVSGGASEGIRLAIPSTATDRPTSHASREFALAWRACARCAEQGCQASVIFAPSAYRR